MIGSDFIKQTSSRTTICSECLRKIPAGVEALVSIKKGKVRKRVCSEDCRLTFDANFWYAVARERHPI